MNDFAVGDPVRANDGARDDVSDEGCDKESVHADGFGSGADSESGIACVGAAFGTDG